MLGRKCYLVMNKRYNESENVFYLEGIGTVFVEPAFPGNVIIQPKYLGYVDTKPQRLCRSYFYGAYYFIFPNLTVPQDDYNRGINYNGLKFNQIEVKDLDVVKVSRLLLEEKKISNSIINKTTLEINDIDKIEVAKQYIEKLKKDNGKSKLNFFGFIKSKPKEKESLFRTKSKRRIKSDYPDDIDNFPDSDFMIN